MRVSRICAADRREPTPDNFAPPPGRTAEVNAGDLRPWHHARLGSQHSTERRGRMVTVEPPAAFGCVESSRVSIGSIWPPSLAG
jgi:hypothetical protein